MELELHHPRDLELAHPSYRVDESQKQHNDVSYFCELTQIVRQRICCDRKL